MIVPRHSDSDVLNDVNGSPLQVQRQRRRGRAPAFCARAMSMSNSRPRACPYELLLAWSDNPRTTAPVPTVRLASRRFSQVVALASAGAPPRLWREDAPDPMQGYSHLQLFIDMFKE